MDFATFETSFRDSQPPPGLPVLVEALWWEAHGDWGRAHTIAQEMDDRDGAWVHAYLHRREGDTANAGYWYRRAGQPVSTQALDFNQERKAIVTALLARGK
jgi:hypothetical protein